MFTGLVLATGTASLRENGDAAELQVFVPELHASLELGDSVAVNGCCLTVNAIKKTGLHFSLLAETLRLTNLRESRLVNLEPALAANGRFGGHLVQGHIDCTAEILSLEKIVADVRLEIELPREFARYVVAKGSIAIDGISLTVAEVRPESFTVWIIPHTFSQTTLREAQVGGRVNLEFDLLAKYVERLLSHQA